MGNSRGVLIPKRILGQVGPDGTADLQVRDGVIEIRAVKRTPREGWAEDVRRLGAAAGDAFVWPELGNEGDAALVW
jgi:antitoxin MazE